MTILLFLLKMIGKILLFLLAFVVVLLLLILFVPICYSIKLDAKEEDFLSTLRGVVSVKALGGLFRGKFSYQEQKSTFRLDFLCFCLKQIPETDSKKEKADKRKKQEVETEKKQSVEEKAEEDRIEKHIPEENLQREEKDSKENTFSNTKALENTKNQRMNFSDDSLKNVSKRKKVSFWSWIQYLKKNIQKKIREWKKSLKRLKRRVHVIKRELQDEGNHEAVKFLLHLVMDLLKHMRPRSGKIQVRFDTGDPARTGQLLGILACIPLVYKKHNYLSPDFTGNQAYLDGTMEMRGHLFVFFLVKLLIRLVRNRNIRRVYKKLHG